MGRLASKQEHRVTHGGGAGHERLLASFYGVMQGVGVAREPPTQLYKFVCVQKRLYSGGYICMKIIMMIKV